MTNRKPKSEIETGPGGRPVTLSQIGNRQSAIGNPHSAFRIPQWNPPIPTVRTLLLLGLGVAVAWAWGTVPAVVLDLGVMVICGLDFGMGSRTARIGACRDCPRRLFQGVPQDVKVHLSNGHSRQIWVRVRDQTPLGWDAAPVLRGTIGARSNLGLHYRVVPSVRGGFVFGDIWLRVTGPLGLVFRQVRIPASQEIQVFPRIRPVSYANLATYRRAVRNWGNRPTRLSREGREFESLREYVQGDDPRRIHWKAAARLDRPISQEYQTERNQIVMILLDAGRLMTAVSQGRSKLDHALEATVQLAQAALSTGDQVGVMAFAHEVLAYIPPNRGRDQLQRILDGVVSLRPQMIEPHYEGAILWLSARVRRRSLVVIFTDLLDEVASESLLEAVGLLRPRHLPLCVAIGEVEWDEILGQAPSKIQDVYDRAVLQGVRRQRRKALAHLHRRGALGVDLPCTLLGSGTLQRYMEVKRRGLL
jgi:uncharacterized protein (DUF58 family)